MRAVQKTTSRCQYSEDGGEAGYFPDGPQHSACDEVCGNLETQRGHCVKGGSVAAASGHGDALWTGIGGSFLC